MDKYEAYLPNALNTRRLEISEEEPGRAVDDGENPAGHDDLFGTTESANCLGLDRMANGNVAFNRKGC